MSALSDTFENRLIDFLLRGQALGLTNSTAAAGSGPTNTFIGLFTTAPTDTGGGVEVTGGSYARATVASSLANWAGTQGAGTTTASTGTGGQTSNNTTITFATPTAGWGTVTAVGVFDAVTGGNLLFYATLGTSKTINTGDTVSFAAGQLTFTLA